MPELETSVMTDEQILGIDDSPEVSSEAAEPSAPVETESQDTAEKPPLRPTGEKADTLPAQKPQQADKADKQQAKPEQGQAAANFEELFPAGIEQAREAHTKAAQLDRSDTAFAN